MESPSEMPAALSRSAQPHRAAGVGRTARLTWSALLGLALYTSGCADSEPAEFADETRSQALQPGDVGNAAATSCSTSAVDGLSRQLIEQLSCITGDAVVEIPARPNLRNRGTPPLLQPAAADALVAALDQRPGTIMEVTSTFRTVAQQYMLYLHKQLGRCGQTRPVAVPGTSNHESGLAIDIGNYGPWIDTLTAHGFRWLGQADDVHFDYANGASLGSESVRAFQQLWNLNHPEDRIGEDGVFGPQMEERLRRSPAGGFPRAAECGGSSVAVTDPRVFDWSFYPTVYADVGERFEGDFWGMVGHWSDHGVAEGRLGGPGFSSRFYLNSYSDLAQAFGSDHRAAIGHFLSAGLSEGRTASPAFDPAYYLGRHEDLRRALGETNYAEAMTHWVQSGIREGRQASPAFDHDYYLGVHSDLQAAFGNDSVAARNHFLMMGLGEGRSTSPVFDARFYLSRHDDLRGAFGDSAFESSLIHWLRTGITECRQASLAFDPRYYLDTHADLKAAFGDNCTAARDHYLATLRTEGRSGSPLFDPGYYLAHYDDVKQAVGNDPYAALLHWMAHGIAEGRRGSAQFDPAYYLQNNRDVAEAHGANDHLAAMQHWLSSGRNEGRRGAP